MGSLVISFFLSTEPLPGPDFLRPADAKSGSGAIVGGFARRARGDILGLVVDVVVALETRAGERPR